MVYCLMMVYYASLHLLLCGPLFRRKAPMPFSVSWKLMAKLGAYPVFLFCRVIPAHQNNQKLL